MNILITGSNGFIGRNVKTLLSDIPDVNIFEGNRNTVNLLSHNSVKNYIKLNNISGVIHCAIEGGRRTKEDTSEIVYKNLLMFENLISMKENYVFFINIASGAEFDRRNNIFKYKEDKLLTSSPSDYYGLSKSIISKRLLTYSFGANLRLFNCFYHNETPDRMIKNNIIRYINDECIIIHKDIYMDFFYMEDLVLVIKYYINNNPQLKDKLYRDVNISYLSSLKLSDIADIINNLSDKKVQVIVEDNTSSSNNYSGHSSVLNSLKLEFKGIEKGIRECYYKIKST